jgi:tetratricopeptide (TPR) repeat protein
VGARAGGLRPWSRSLLSPVLVIAALLAPTALAGAAVASPNPVSSAHPRPSPAASRPAPSVPAGGSLARSGGAGSEKQPSPAQIAAQAKAQALDRQVQEQASDAEVARAALADASRAAATALEIYHNAVQAQQQAQLVAALAQARLEQAGQAVDEQRAALGRWAWQAYVSGGVLTRSPAMITLLDGGDTDQIATAQAVVRSVGDGQAQVLAALKAAQSDRQQALDTATTAQQAADADAARAQQAKTVADDAVTRHRTALEHAQQVLKTTQQASADAAREAQLLSIAGSYAGSLPGGHGITGPVGDCHGGDVSAFPNGRLPLALLCPVSGAPGKYLRADAAYAFDRLSSAYAQVFGAPICVTSAYRSFEDQVRVYAERPGFAARPGTSNHGWGTAADLCGGIDSFSSRTHAWMLANAPLFGWYHPSWAEPTGSLPEPWHWEFGG